MRNRALPTVVAVLSAIALLGMIPVPARAAGPNQPVDISSVEVASNELDGTVVLPDGTAILTIQTRYSECIQGGACGDDPTVMEVAVGQASRSCKGLNGCNAAWQPGGRRQYFQRDVSAFRNGYIQLDSPTLASLGLGNLPAESWVGVSVRLRNPAGWSQSFAASIQVARALDPADTVPTNLTAPELGSYGQSLTRDLVIGNWIDLWSAGRWAPGAVTPATSIRVQAARCPDAACRLTPAQYEASGLQATCAIARVDLATRDVNCRPKPWTEIAAADTCWRARTQAGNRKGWSTWSESAVKCLPAANSGSGGAIVGGSTLDLANVAPLRPNVGAVDLVQPSPQRLPTFNLESNPASPIAARGTLTEGTAYGATGTAWRLPNGWRAPNLLANTTFTLFTCSGTEAATCTAAGTWAASRLVGQSPSLNSIGSLDAASAYARIAQTTTMLNSTGARVTRTALSDWVSVSAAAPRAPAATPAPTPVPTPTASADASTGAGAGSSGSSPDVPAAVDIPPALVAAGVDGRVTPLVGTNGEGTYKGTTLKVQVPAIEPRGVKIKATAIVTPRTRGKVWFTTTRTLPDGKVRVDRTRKVTVRGTKARASWTFAASKPTGTYLLIVRFVPRTKGKVGAMVTKAILVK